MISNKMNKQAAQEIYQNSTQLVKDRIDEYILLLHKQDTRKKMQSTIDIINKSKNSLKYNVLDIIQTQNPHKLISFGFHRKHFDLRHIILPHEANIARFSIYYFISKINIINGKEIKQRELWHAEDVRRLFFRGNEHIKFYPFVDIFENDKDDNYFSLQFNYIHSQYQLLNYFNQ